MRWRVCRFFLLLIAAWIVMTFTHELGHIVAGIGCGGTLRSFDLVPWRLPHSLFHPDPYPLVTLWSGLVLGVLAPVAIASLVKREAAWFIANFCILANGTYAAVAWVSGDSYLDTPKLIAHGASPILVAGYCALTIAVGYAAFRRSCIRALTAPTESRQE